MQDANITLHLILRIMSKRFMESSFSFLFANALLYGEIRSTRESLRSILRLCQIDQCDEKKIHAGTISHKDPSIYYICKIRNHRP